MKHHGHFDPLSSLNFGLYEQSSFSSPPQQIIFEGPITRFEDSKSNTWRKLPKDHPRWIYSAIASTCLLKLSGNWDEFGGRSSDIAIQSPIVPLVLRVAARTDSGRDHVVIPIADDHLVVHISRVLVRGVAGPRLLLGGQRRWQNLGLGVLLLRLVADNQQLF